MDRFDLRLWDGFIAAGGDPATPAVIDQVAIDSRRIDSSHALFVALPGAHCDGHQFIANTTARYALVRKDWVATTIPAGLSLLRVDDPLQAFQRITTAYRLQLPTKIVAIAGSYGKTMVKDLLEAMLATTKCVAASPESFNSQIGVALSLLSISKKHEIALIEASVSKKGEMDRLAHMIQPDYTVITHIGKKHITTLGGLESVAEEILQLPLQVPAQGWSILPNVPLIQPGLPRLRSSKHFWNVSAAELPHATAVEEFNGTLMPYHIQFPDGSEYVGRATFGFAYFLDLLNITIKAAWLLGVPSEAIRSILTTYSAEPTRTEIWRSQQGTTFINEPYCSDPQSVNRALKHFEQSHSKGKKIFIFGGMRGQQQHAQTDYRFIGQSITRAQIDHLLLAGSYPFESLIEEIKQHSPNTTVTLCHDYQEAFDTIQPTIDQDDIVLIKGSKKEPLDSITEAFNDSRCNNQCLINLAAIEANIGTIRNKIGPKTRIMVMVKALAYGTNDIRMSQFLATCGVDIFGVSYLDEGIALKRAGISQAIFVINAALHEAAKAVKWDLEIGVGEKELISALAIEAARKNKKVKVHLHVDTGMSRFGCRPEEALELAKQIVNSPSLILEGIMTHFASADDPASDAFTLEQADCLEKVIQQLGAAGITAPWRHAANSSATLRFDFPQFNMVRIGLAVYGLYPSKAAEQALQLQLAISLVSRIVGINTCRAGETISYGRSYVVERDLQRIAVLPIGYFDGLHRHHSEKHTVTIRGHHAPMVGRICMDFMMVDITDIPSAAIGDSVLIFGEDEYGHYQSPEDFAESGNTIVYELITCLGPRIERIFIHEEASHLR